MTLVASVEQQFIIAVVIEYVYECIYAMITAPTVPTNLRYANEVIQ